MKKLINNCHCKRICMAVFAGCFILVLSQNAVAQLKPSNAIYFFNEFLVNPAMASRNEKMNATFGFRQQLSSFAGAPKSQSLAADYSLSARAGLGLKFNNDEAGLLKQTSVAATYAYHLPLNEQDRLSFGISVGIKNDKLNETGVSGDLNDPDVVNVNQRKTFIDTDFGVVYSLKALTLQAVFPNMIGVLKDNRNLESDYALFFSAISYKVQTNFGQFEPKAVFRGVKGFKNIVDVGTNFIFESSNDNELNIFGMYHSSKNASVGFGLTFNKNFRINSSYTMSTTELSGNSAGDFELGLGLKL